MIIMKQTTSIYLTMINVYEMSKEGQGMTFFIVTRKATISKSTKKSETGKKISEN